MKDSINGDRRRKRQRERETEIKGGPEHHNKRRIRNRKALPTAETPPSHLPTRLLRVTQCEMEKKGYRHSGPQCCQQSSSQKFRGRSYTQAQYARYHFGLCHLGLCFFYFWFVFLFFFFFHPNFPFHPICNPKGESVNCHWTVGYRRRRLCHVVVALWLSLAGSGWALHPMASGMSLRI